MLIKWHCFVCRRYELQKMMWQFDSNSRKNDLQFPVCFVFLKIKNNKKKNEFSGNSAEWNGAVIQRSNCITKRFCMSTKSLQSTDIRFNFRVSFIAYLYIRLSLLYSLISWRGYICKIFIFQCLFYSLNN